MITPYTERAYWLTHDSTSMRVMGDTVLLQRASSSLISQSPSWQTAQKRLLRRSQSCIVCHVSAAQILDSLPKLSDEELRQVCHVLDTVFRERHQVVVDDEYGTLTEEDFATLAGEAWSVIDGHK